MPDFRIMPAQRLTEMKDVTHVRYGFIISNHPLGCEGKEPHETYRDTGKVYNRGDYIASWETEKIARMAAHCLGYLPWIIQTVPVLFAENGVDWSVEP